MDAKDVMDSIDNNAPMWLKSPLKFIFYHHGTPWFFIGVGVEALAISISYLFVQVSFPSLDAITGLLIGFGMLYYFKKNDKK